MSNIRTQKLLVTLIIVTSCVLLWQIGQLFVSRNNVIAATPAAVKPVSKLANDPVVNEKPSPTVANASATMNDILKNTNTLPPEGLSIDTANESQYLSIVNEYQIAQLQRMLEEEKAAIAIAKRNAAQASGGIAKEDSNRIIVSDQTNLADSSSDLTPASYSVRYVDFQNNHWTAVLEKAGHFVEVAPGDVLADGQRVATINNTGVTLQNGDDTLKIRFQNNDIGPG